MSLHSACRRCGRSLAPSTVGPVCETCLSAITVDSLGSRVDVVDGPTATARPAWFDRTTLPPQSNAPENDFPTIAGYTVLEMLGEGGGGAVYRARQAVTDREVALKVIPTRRSSNRERFRREVAALAKLHHENVVDIYEVGECADGLYFSMRLMAGGSVATLRRGRKLTIEESCSIMERVARAVHAAHEAGFIHRDLKPGNILLDADGVPNVSDFGLVKFVDRGSTDRTLEQLTSGHAFLGTPSYASPEQFIGDGDRIDRRSDVYGLGATLYDLLTARPPYRGHGLADTARLVEAGKLVSPSTFNADVTPELDAIVRKALAVEPANRFATAAEFADELARIRTHQPTQTRPRMTAGRRGFAVVAVVALLMLTIGGGWYAFRGDGKSPDGTASTEIAKDSSPVKSTALEPVTATRNPLFSPDEDVRTLIGPTGPPITPPVRFRGTYGDAEPPDRDPVWAISSAGNGYIELIKMHRIEPFILTIDVRHDSTANTGMGWVGVYFMPVREMWPNDVFVQQTYRLTFSDFQIPTTPMRPVRNKVRLEHVGTIGSIGQVEQVTNSDLGFEVSSVRQSIEKPRWRTLRIEYRDRGPSEGLAVTFQDLNAEPTRLRPALISRQELQDSLNERRKTLADMRRVDVPPNLPEWTLEGSFGVCIQYGQASFRNLRFTRIREPKVGSTRTPMPEHGPETRTSLTLSQEQ